MDASSELLASLKGDKYALLREISKLVNDSMLKEIANADYGMDADEYFGLLRSIRGSKGGDELEPYIGEALEVLNLIRHSTPGRKDRDGHIMRSFACAAILRIKASGVSLGYLDCQDENVILAALLESLETLGATYQNCALSFIVWRLECIGEENTAKPFYIFALLVLGLQAKHTFTDKQVAVVINWLYREEHNVRSGNWAVFPDHSPQWLLGLTYFDSHHSIWVSLGEDLLNHVDHVEDLKIRDRIREIASKLTNCRDQYH